MWNVEQRFDPKALEGLAALGFSVGSTRGVVRVEKYGCGAEFRQLTNTHLRAHRLTADEYKRRFGYNRGRPLMCRALHELYASRAVETGLAAQIRQRPILVHPELRRRGGAREIALEELLTRREVRERARKGSLPFYR